MKIERDYFYVNGTYYLKTSGDTSIMLVYPFPVDPLFGSVDSVRIFNLTSNKLVKPLVIGESSCMFNLDFETNNEIIILVAYRQKLLGYRAEYILKSTASWRKPLEEATYQLIIPSGMEIIDFSIPPGEYINTDLETIYYWTKENYMPAKNMVFEFEEK